MVDELERTGMLVNAGASDKPRYVLDRGDRRVEILGKIYGPVRYEAAGRRLG